MDKKKELELKQTSESLRIDILNMVYKAQSGHIGGSFSIIDILTYIYENDFDKDNDVVILSKGHTSPALYAILKHKRIIKSLDGFRTIFGSLQGHPSNKTPGVVYASGSLGQGLSAAIGVALAKRYDKNPGHVYCILGDGEMQEGNVYEALLSLAKYSLTNLTVIVDCNNVQLDGFVSDIKNIYPLVSKLDAFALSPVTINGHDFKQIERAFNKKCEFPKVILANTIKGKGVPFMENTNKWHGQAPSKVEYLQALEILQNNIQKISQNLEKK